MITSTLANLADGRSISVLIRNDGYVSNQRGYLTTFFIDGTKKTSLFESKRYRQFQCPTPDARLACDMAALEHAVEIQCGSAFEELIDLD